MLFQLSPSLIKCPRVQGFKLLQGFLSSYFDYAWSIMIPNILRCLEASAKEAVCLCNDQDSHVSPVICLDGGCADFYGGVLLSAGSCVCFACASLLCRWLLFVSLSLDLVCFALCSLCLLVCLERKILVFHFEHDWRALSVSLAGLLCKF